MSEESLVTVTRSHDDKAAHVTLNRPAKLNAINPEMASELEDVVQNLERDDTVRLLTIQGAGGNFCAGVDIDGIHKFVKDSKMDDLRNAEAQIEECFATLADCSLPSLSLVEGYALAGGLEVLLLTDFIVAAEDAKIGDQHINRNLVPGGGSTQRLPRRIGQQRAKELIFTGKRISGTEAAEWGLATEAVDADDLEETRDRWTEDITSKGRRTLTTAKYLVEQSQSADLDTGIELEKFVSTAHFFTEEGKEGLRSFSEDE